jgi:hypothetical protein
MDWTNLVVQVPIVAAFIWYSLEQQKRFAASMDKRDEAYLAALDKISCRIEKHDDHSVDHDKHCVEHFSKQPTRRRAKSNDA